MIRLSQAESGRPIAKLSGGTFLSCAHNACLTQASSTAELLAEIESTKLSFYKEAKIITSNIFHLCMQMWNCGNVATSHTCGILANTWVQTIRTAIAPSMIPGGQDFDMYESNVQSANAAERRLATLQQLRAPEAVTASAGGNASDRLPLAHQQPTQCQPRRGAGEQTAESRNICHC